MRIKKAIITGFGKWQQQTFLFEPKNQLVFGLNEAGKSTLYQFIQAILFGFPTKRKKQHDYTPTDGTGFGGKLVVQHALYGEVVIERFKHKNKGKAHVILAGGETGGEELLEKMLFPLNLTLFQQVFTFQQEQLQQLDHLTEGELHDALISLGLSGSNQLFDQKVALQEQASQLYRPKGRKLAINQALQVWQALQQKIQQKEAQEAEFQQLVEKAWAVQQAVAEQEQTLHQTQAEKLQVEQQRLNWENYVEYQTLAQKDLTVKGSSAQRQALQAFYQQYQQLVKEQDKLQQALKEHSGLDQNSARYYFYLEHEEAITQLLNEKVDLFRQLDEQTRLDQLLAQPLQATFTQMPQPFEETELVQKWVPLTKLEQQLAEQTLRKQLLEEQKVQAEAQLNRYEQAHPELFGQPKRFSWIFYGLAGILLVSSFFMPAPLRYGLVLLAAGSAFYGWKNKPRGNKEMWQEKLTQLDQVEGQLAQLKTTSQTLHQQLQQQTSALQEQTQARHLNFSSELQVMKEHNQQAQQFVAASAQQKKWAEQRRDLQAQLVQQAQRFDFLGEWLPLEGLSISEKFARLEQFAKEMEQVRFAQTYQENTILQQRINQAKKEEQVLRAENQTLLEKFQLHYPAEIPEFLQVQQANENDHLRLETLAKSIRSLFPQPTTLEAITAKSQALSQAVEQQQERLHALQERAQRLKLQVEQLQQDGTLDQLYQEKSQQQALLVDLLKRYSGAKIESQLLQDLATERSQQQLPQLMAKAAHYFAVLTDQQATLDFTDGQLFVTRNSQSQSLYQLSTGTKDQVIMALRFAYLALQEKTLAPIMIDDGWLHYDHQRKFQLAKLLAEFSQQYQVICLSSDQEMVSYYQELHQPVWELKGT